MSDYASCLTAQSSGNDARTSSQNSLKRRVTAGHCPKALVARQMPVALCKDADPVYKNKRQTQTSDATTPSSRRTPLGDSSLGRIGPLQHSVSNTVYLS